ncbi:squalene-hopene/tetraprenyl-beta-curcumene cyclase [Stella humosa]|uniref:Squalene-hopene/tetraprenyl-beta-curcumene cyclase n=1 Tax=Stella humosa TaxID=94 RepID=A0A3N1KT06_9PROT|nr:squalene--hopene cyclase [Stella humosa]ROP81256.1 squalene-hopene/tetraprenyl-beta-curcumene cyclase [Stella humosa]BBK32604.1 squalene-hopene cyclase [Stella humosa]
MVDADFRRSVGQRLATAVDGLLAAQRPDGEWCFELEADATIPAEYILLNHFLGDPDPQLEQRLARYLRRAQGADGGWPLFHGGAGDLSATVKAYFALKLVGDDPDAPAMAGARRLILSLGGAGAANVFTRIMLALFGQVPWRAVPAMPVEIMLLPRWSPFHLDKVAYWSRVVIVPLLILMALKPRAANPRGVTIAELFAAPAAAPRPADRWARLFLAVDAAVRLAEPMLPGAARRRAMDAAVRFLTERLNGEDGLGAIFPAMANAVMALTALGRPPGDPDLVCARSALRRLVVEDGGEARCQPCLSPVWDTALSLLALEGVAGTDGATRRGRAWLLDRQVTDKVGDWRRDRPGLAPGGWAFQYRNDHYPDLDDTAAVVLALDGHSDAATAIARAAGWVVGMQSRNGGWGAFDADNTHHRLNHIPFADHGALLDPPTADVSARCLAALGRLGRQQDRPAVARGLAFLQAAQEADGSWFGRWGTNHVYGTWSALSALAELGLGTDDPAAAGGIRYLLGAQRPDGSWGEDGLTYRPAHRGFARAGTASQTAWALLGLMAGGQAGHPAVTAGIRWLVEAPADGPFWDEPWHTGTGFPNVFHLRYRGYPAYFPIWALARWDRLVGRG